RHLFPVDVQIFSVAAAVRRRLAVQIPQADRDRRRPPSRAADLPLFLEEADDDQQDHGAWPRSDGLCRAPDKTDAGALIDVSRRCERTTSPVRRLALRYLLERISLSAVKRFRCFVVLGSERPAR